MRIVILGYPGAGKGTQAGVLAGRYGLSHIATGDLFRAEIAAKSALGLKVSDYLRNGTLVPDQLVVEMVTGRLDKASGGFILDGFPRTLEQAQALDRYLSSAGQRIDVVFYLEMRSEDVLRRLTSRSTCSGCGALYNLVTAPPRTAGKCDRCGGELRQREDDGEATVRKRLMVYEDLTRPLLAYYRAEQVLHAVDGAQPVEKVTEDLFRVLEAGVAGKSHAHN